MDCIEFLDGYSDYDDSLVTRAEAESFRRHMEECAACARYDRVLRKGRMLARQVEAPAPEGDFVPRLEERLWMEAGPRSSVAPAVAGGFLTLALAAVLGVWVFQIDGPGAPVAADDVHVHDDTPFDRALVLPATAYAEPSDWSAPRVDRRVAPSYSPLVTGPPAYRADRRASPSTSPPPRHTLD